MHGWSLFVSTSRGRSSDHSKQETPRGRSDLDLRRSAQNYRLYLRQSKVSFKPHLVSSPLSVFKMPTSRFEPSSIKNKFKREEISRKVKKNKGQAKLQKRLAQAKAEADNPGAKKVSYLVVLVAMFSERFYCLEAAVRECPAYSR